MSNDSCFFCKIANKEVPAEIIFENDDAVVIFDKFPASLGHILVIPKKHVSNIFEADEQTVAAVFKVVSKVSKALKKSMNLQGMNILQNNGSIAGQTIFHLHIHLIPRSSVDNIDIKWGKVSPTQQEIDNLMSALRSELHSEGV